MTPAPTPRHQMLLGNLTVTLHQFVKSRGLGMVLTFPLEVELAPQSCIVQADLLYVARSRVDALFGEERITGGPDLTAQVLSPNTEHMDRTVKLVEYARAGVREYWIVDPYEPSIVVYSLDGDAYCVAGMLFAGDVIGVGLFAEAKIEVDAIFGV